jgi:cardiolipin synthase
MTDLLLTYWPVVTSAALFVADVVATGHVVLFKRDTRAAIGWVGLIWLVPVVGTALYVLFGINRIRRKARRLRRRGSPTPHPDSAGLPAPADGIDSLRRLVGRVTGRPTTSGNRIQPLPSGEAAYTEMLAGIAAAERSIGLSSYIFDNDATGRTFADALAAAVRRGVQVRVLIDDIGSRYSFPSVVGRLRREGVTVARFLPSLLPWRFAYAQLRNHRKLLVIDGAVGFTGGMNIRDGHDVRTSSRYPITDCHFRIDGPVVADLRAVFADDWQFATGERLHGPDWFPPLTDAGSVVARGIASGPNDEVETLRLACLGAIAAARRSVTIVTPYFLPDDGLISALEVAALRGVRVDVVLPERNNLLLVQWAMIGQLPPLLEHGCRVWLALPPFDHTKLFLVDGEWCLIGSANWDARSLRLNFEFDVECYDRELVGELTAAVERKMSTARRLTLADLNRRNLLVRLRDGIARLASPYL